MVFIAYIGQTHYKSHLGRQPQIALAVVNTALQIVYLVPGFHGLCWSEPQAEIFLSNMSTSASTAILNPYSSHILLQSSWH